MDFFPVLCIAKELGFHFIEISEGFHKMPCKPVRQACDAAVGGAHSCCGWRLLHFGLKSVPSGWTVLWGHKGASAAPTLSSLLSLVSYVNAVAAWAELFPLRAEWVTALTRATIKILRNCWHRLADIPLYSDNSDSKLNWLQGASVAFVQ